MILAWSDEKLSCGQPQNEVKIDFQVKFDIEGKGRSPSETIGTLTHWGRVTHICVSQLTTIGCDNGLSPGRHQAITWTNAGMLLIGPWRTAWSESLIEISYIPSQEYAFENFVCEVAVILAWTVNELSSGQTRDRHTANQINRHTHTDAGNDNIRRPKSASDKTEIRLRREPPSMQNRSQECGYISMLTI